MKKLVMKRLMSRSSRSFHEQKKRSLVDDVLNCSSQIRIGLEVYASLLKQCTVERCLADGIRVHRHLLSNGYSRNSYLGNLAVHMYGKCGSVEEARKAFDGIPRRNTYSWNIMLAAYVHNGNPWLAIQLFKQMQAADDQQGGGLEADKFTLATVLAACAATLAVAEARQIHHRIVSAGAPECDTVLETALLDTYTKCGCLEEARAVFGSMKKKDVVCWTAMITACAQQGQAKEALQLYRGMEAQGLQPDCAAYTSVVGACASLRALAQGKAIHARIVDEEKLDDMLHSALINMYARCGALEDAASLFQQQCTRNLDSWNVIVAAYAQHGHPIQVLELYARMVLQGVEPDWITFTSILYACSHAGMQKQGRLCFCAMLEDHGISPLPQHFNCIIDLLGRAGRLEEAEELITSLNFKPDFVPWTSLLNACKIHRDVDRAARVAERLSRTGQLTGDELLQSSNIGKLGDALEVTHGMQDRSVKKLTGCSSIQVDDEVHEFSAGNMLHPANREIRAELEVLKKQIQEAGYVPDSGGAIMDTASLWYHSEKMAIAYGLISTKPGQTLRVFNNLRVCSDCHAAFKFISKARSREIILRDGTRFHCFKQGSCSCGDYW